MFEVLLQHIVEVLYMVIYLWVICHGKIKLSTHLSEQHLP